MVVTIDTLDTASLNERAHDLLRDAILSAEFAPGQRLHVAHIAARLGVSQTPVKDALNRLAAEGLVTILPRKGTFVSSFDWQDLEELLDVRRVLEIRACELAIDRITDSEIARMSEMLEGIRQVAARADTDGFRRERIANDIAFHRVLLSASGSRRLVEMWEAVHAHVLVARATYPLDRFRKTDQEHNAIVEALNERSLPHLRDAVDYHLRQVIENVRRAASTVPSAWTQGEHGEQAGPSMSGGSPISDGGSSR